MLERNCLTTKVGHTTAELNTLDPCLQEIEPAALACDRELTVIINALYALKYRVTAGERGDNTAE